MKSLYGVVLLLVLGLAASVRADDSHLDRLTQKLKKDCEDQGGSFVLQSADTKHSAAEVDAAVPGHPADHGHGLVGEPDLSGNGQTAFQATGECTYTMTLP